MSGYNSEKATASIAPHDHPCHEKGSDVTKRALTQEGRSRMRVLVRRKKRGRLLVVLCALIVVGSLLIFVSVHRGTKLSPLNDKKTLPSFLDDEDAFVQAVVKAEERSKGFRRETEENTETNNDRCTMADCFDLSRCFSNFKVYVYPPNSATKSSFLYGSHESVDTILKILTKPVCSYPASTHWTVIG